MPQLANEQHEQFARFVASGKSLTEASRLSGHQHGANNFGARLMRRDEISQRILELRAIPAGQECTSGNVPTSSAPSQDVLMYTTKPWVVVELVSVHQLARKAKDYGVSHAVLKTLAQIGGHLNPQDGGAIPDLQRKQALTLLGVHELHTMLKQITGGVNSAERRALLAQAPELAELIAEPESPTLTDESTPDAGV